MSKFIPSLSLATSPITKNQEIVQSRWGQVTDDDGNIVDGSFQIDAKEVIELIEWLDHKQPLLYSTKSLVRAAEAMRESLMEILEAVREDN